MQERLLFLGTFLCLLILLLLVLRLRYLLHGQLRLQGIQIEGVARPTLRRQVKAHQVLPDDLEANFVLRRTLTLGLLSFLAHGRKRLEIDGKAPAARVLAAQLLLLHLLHQRWLAVLSLQKGVAIFLLGTRMVERHLADRLSPILPPDFLLPLVYARL